jgi:hypothetical protein
MHKSNRKKLVWGAYFDEAPAAPPATPATPAPVVPATPAPVVPATPAPAANLVPKADLDKALADKAALEKQLADAKKEMPVPNPAEKPAAPAATAPEAPVDNSARLLAEMDARLKASELKNFKLNAIRDAGSDLFAELVGGDSEEAILESITKSKARYQEVFEKGKASAPAPAAPAATPATPEPGSPASAVPTAIRPEAYNSQELSYESIQAMSDADYAKNRDRIKSEMSGFKYQGM